MRNIIETKAEFDYAVVDLSANSTTVLSAPGLVRGIYINTTMSAHDLLIKDGTTTVFTIPAATPAGTLIPLLDVTFKTSIVFDPNDSATGSITVGFKRVI